MHMNIQVSPGKSRKKKIMIIGAGGFIGTNLTRRLLRDDYNLVCADLPRADLRIAEEFGATVLRCDIASIDDRFMDALKGVDILFHLVSTTCPTNSNTKIADEVSDNVVSTLRVFDACVKAGVRRVVFLSSGGTVYGREHDGLLSEDHPTDPISSYGLQKLVIEKYLRLYQELYGLDYRIVRLSNPYGPYQRPDGIQGLVAACTWKVLHRENVEIYGDGTVIRDYIFIDDAIEGIVNIAFSNSRYRLYNLGSGVGTSVMQVVEYVGRVLNTNPRVHKTPARAVDVPVNVLNIDRYVSEFGNPVTIDFDEGIWRLAQFYERNY